MIMDETTASKVDNFDLTSRIRLDQDVLRLQITVNNVFFEHVVEAD